MLREFHRRCQRPPPLVFGRTHSPKAKQAPPPPRRDTRPKSFSSRLAASQPREDVHRSTPRLVGGQTTLCFCHDRRFFRGVNGRYANDDLARGVAKYNSVRSSRNLLTLILSEDDLGHRLSLRKGYMGIMSIVPNDFRRNSSRHAPSLLTSSPQTRRRSRRLLDQMFLRSVRCLPGRRPRPPGPRPPCTSPRSSRVKRPQVR